MTTPTNPPGQDVSSHLNDPALMTKERGNNSKTIPEGQLSPQDSLKAKILLGFWSIIILGLPIWLYTTHQQRTALNESDITNWFQEKQYQFQIPLNINIRWDNQLKYGENLKTFNEEFNEFATDFITSNERNFVKNDNPLVKIQPNIVNSEFSFNPSSWKYIDTEDSDAQSQGTLNYVVNVVQHNQVKDKIVWDRKEEVKYYVLPLRHFILLTKSTNSKTIVSQTQDLINAILHSSQDSMNAPVLNGNNQRSGIKYAKHYQLTFSLMNEDISSFQPSWDYEYIHHQFNKHLLHLLKNVSSFTVATQIHHISPLSVQPQTQVKNGVQNRYLAPSQLPQFVNSADWNIASAVLTEPDIHFLLYLPSSPLSIQYGPNEFSQSFLIPKWGGVYITETPNDQEVELASKELEPIVKQFLNQFKELLGIFTIQDTFQSHQLKVDQLRYTTLTGWELDQYLLKRSMENIFDTVSTLNSLITLVNEIKNMVILQKIKDQTQTCLNHLDRAFELLNQGKIQQGFQYTREALTLAELSFFDPSMVGLMYFPSEHKWAVYAPLFAPVLVTLLRASVVIFKKWRIAKNQLKSKTN